MDISLLLKSTIDAKASDLHLVCGYYPSLRIDGKIKFLRDTAVLTKTMTDHMLPSLLTKEQAEYLAENKEIDIGYSYGDERFRVNIYTVRGNLAAAFRLIPKEIKTIEELHLPSIFDTFTTYKQGLILFTGPTGEGKSTSLASLINKINLSESKNIITIEDPVEFIYPYAKSVISQREVHSDTLSWTKSLKSVLREDPDVVLVGEMRDFETIQSVLTIAETGHLVFSTLHTGSTPEAIDRIIDVFPSHQQNQVRNILSNVLIAVVAQRLLPNASSPGLVPATEILINTPAVSSLIRDGKTFMIDSVLETSESKGMILFEKYLLQLYQQNLITREDAISFAIRKNEIRKFIT